MRATLKDVLHSPSWLGEWWIDLPARRKWWWRELLFMPGAGWLRWKQEMVESYRSYWEPPDPIVIFPPLHRLWLMLRYGIGFDELKDPERMRLFR